MYKKLKALQDRCKSRNKEISFSISYNRRGSQSYFLHNKKESCVLVESTNKIKMAIMESLI